MKAASKASPVARWWDPLAALLLMCAILTAATRLVVTRWTDDLYLVQTLGFLGVILGLALGQSRFSGRLVFIIFLIFTAFVIPWQLSSIVDEMPWGEKLGVIVMRLINTIDQVVTNKPVTDNILFISLMALLFWLLSVHAAYSIARHGAAWQAILPSGLALLVIHTYDPYLIRRVWFLAAYLLFGMILVARMHFVDQRMRWSSNHAHLPPDIGFDWIRYTLIVAVAVTLFAWVVPVTAQTIQPAEEAWQYIRRPWVTFQDRMSHAFTSLRSSVGLVTDYYSGNLTLSRGTQLSDTPVFTVDTPPRTFLGNRYYWQAYSYDHYQAGQWESTLRDTKDIDPAGGGLPQPNLPSRQTQTFKFKLMNPIQTFYLPAQPVSVNMSAKAFYGVMPDGTVDLAGLQSVSLLNAGQTYEATSSLSTVTITQLRAAGINYPEWVKDHYLQLPGTITPRTRQLAEELTTGITNPYDMAAAITSYLRTYKYSVTIDAPPSNQEMMDWWLFDYKKGFCQYYATAEVVLLRSLGIPARFAVGYAQGELVADQSGTPVQSTPNADSGYNRQGGTYLVRQRDAHAWPEVYFPGYGWVEFEPTASQSALVRPSGEIGANIPSPLDPNSEFERGPSRPDIPPSNQSSNTAGQIGNQYSWLIVPLSIVASVILLVFLVILLIRRNPQLVTTPLPLQLENSFIRLGVQPPKPLKRWADYARLSPVVRAYLEINRALSRIGKTPAPKDTPAERTINLSHMIPATAEPAQMLLRDYQVIIYSQGQPASDGPSAQQAGREIRKLSYFALFQKWIARFQEPFRRGMRK